MTDHSEASLSERMARAARELQEQEDPQGTLDSAVRLAVSNVEGCDAAGISIVHAKTMIDSVASTEQLVVDADRLQYETGEGPCLDAAWEERTVYSPDLGQDARWPTWGPRVVAETGARSALSFQLFTNRDTLGALNLYSRTVDGFDQADRDDGLAVAAHIAVAVAGARKIEQLSAAVDTRTVIGQATGILMERFNVDAARGFAVLTRLSSHSNRKLRDIAREVVQTRTVPGLGETDSH